MRLRLFSKPAGRAVRLAGASLALCLLVSDVVLGHPELPVQVEQLDLELAQQPNNAELLIRRGDIYRREGNFAAAEADFSAARSLTPEDQQLDFYEGRLSLDMGFAARADELLSRYLLEYPQHIAAWSLRGDARMALGQPLAAAVDFATAIDNSQRPSPGMYLKQASAYRAAGENHWQQALVVIDTGLGKFPIEVSLLGLGTDIALQYGQLEKARTYLETLPEPMLQLPQWQQRSAVLESKAAN